MKRPSNALALAVLTLLFEQPMHPYQMSSTLRHRHKEESIRLNYGSLYSVVDSLAKKGLIAAGEAHREGNRPERTVYQLTDDGELAMREWLAEMLRDPSPQYTDFEAALSLAGALPPSEVLDLLRHRIRSLKIVSAQYEGALAVLPEGFPELFRIEGDYAAALRRAETTFVERLVEKLENDTLDGTDMWRRIHELRDAGHTGDDLQQRLQKEFGDVMEWDV
ncbi:PadR family transcriptional regulator [Aeromicrobium sp.]|uniref:PadR family transcriptional regulator n=1 Tax=Aeromicrobium sp. TaxID=1871063 RepID=UPI003C458F41